MSPANAWRSLGNHVYERLARWTILSKCNGGAMMMLVALGAARTMTTVSIDASAGALIGPGADMNVSVRRCSGSAARRPRGPRLATAMDEGMAAMGRTRGAESVIYPTL